MATPMKKLDTTMELLCPGQTNREDDVDPEDSKLWGSKRLVVVIYIFFGYIYLFMLHANLSIAIVEMTSNKTIVTGNQTLVQPAEFSWNSKTKGWILSVFTYGYFFSAVGGYLSTKFGGANVYGIGYLATAVLTMLTPLTIRTNLYLFVVGRIAEGVFEGFSYASSVQLWSRWIPKEELPILISCSHMGYFVGSAITYPLCGYLAHHWGWPMIFYFSGTTAVIWCMLFFTFVRNDPSSHKTISAGELKYIERTTGLKEQKITTYPWKKIFTSKPVWALCACKFAYSWTISILVICFPLYIKDITNKTTFEVGILSGIPNYLNILITPLSGLLINYLQHKVGMEKTTVHKWILCSGYSLGGVLLALVGFADFTTSMIFFILTLTVISTNIVVLQMVAIHISPNHAGVIAGISAFWYTLSSLISPTLVGFIVINHSWQQWNTCFIISGIVLILVALINGLYGSSDDQKWSSELRTS